MSLLNLLPPTLVIAAISFLIRFFGRAIEDQAPFADDREWSIELKGFLFMTNVAWFGLIGVTLATYYPLITDGSFLHLVTFVILSSILGHLYLNVLLEGQKIFKIKFKSVEYIDKVLNEHSNIIKPVNTGLTLITIFYLGTLEFFAGNPLGIMFSCLMIFFILFYMAIDSSLRMLKNQNVAPVSIHFSDPNEKTISNATILKINEDNIRLRSEDKIIFLNKDKVSRIEMLLPEEILLKIK